ncbi:MAG: hypothetical protein ACLQMF_11290 [Rectinemataceae bacterium]
MSLLEKALSGTNPTRDRSGLFAKASAVQAHVSTPPPSGAVRSQEAEDPGESVYVIPHFAFTIAEIAALEEELLDLRDTPDYFLSVFARISEAVPLGALALFLPREEGLTAAASLGFPAISGEYIPESVARRSVTPGSLLPRESTAVLSSLLGVSSALRLRGATILGPHEEILGQWVFVDGALESADGETVSALGRLLAAPGMRGAPPLVILSPRSDPAGELLSVPRNERYAAALVLDLKPGYAELDLRVPGILSISFFSAAAAAARLVLGRSGAAVLTENGLLVCLFFGTSALDPDLALFQFRKSLKRFLPIIEGIELPAGRSSLLDLESGTAKTNLSRFLAE